MKFIETIIRMFKRKNDNSITIGKSRFVLVRGKAVSYRSVRNGPKLSLYSSSRWKRSRKLIRINPLREPNPHVIIVGMSGYGKSTLFKSMLMDIQKIGIAAILFDAHNEHERLVKSLNGNVYNAKYSGINILELNGMSKEERTSELVSLFTKVYGLGHIQATKLSRCLYYTYRKKSAPNISDLINELSIFIGNAKGASELNTLMHLKEKLSLLRSSSFLRNPVSVEGLSNGISSFSLAGLKSGEARAIYIHELLKRIYMNMKSNEREKGIRIFIMIDEAQFLLGSQKEYSAIRSIVEEGRKYGSGVIIATHVTANLDRQILANASTLISFYSRDPSEVMYISNAMSGSEPTERELIRNKLRSLRQNEAIVVSGLMKSPAVVQTPTAQQVNRVIEKTAISAKPDYSKSYELQKLTEYSKASASIGEDNVKGMIDDGVVETMDDDGKRYVMEKNPSKSIEHELNVRKISDKLKEFGTRHYIMNNSRGPDIVAYMKGNKTAIEYETGRKSAASTAKMLASREKAFSSTIVLVNDSAATFYKGYFGSENVKVLGISELQKLKDYKLS